VHPRRSLKRRVLKNKPEINSSGNLLFSPGITGESAAIYSGNLLPSGLYTLTNFKMGARFITEPSALEFHQICPPLNQWRTRGLLQLNHIFGLLCSTAGKDLHLALKIN